MPAKKNHSISVYLNQGYPSIVKSEGIYLYDDTGKRYLDASKDRFFAVSVMGMQKLPMCSKNRP